MAKLSALLRCESRLARSLEFEARVQVGGLFVVCLFVCALHFRCITLQNVSLTRGSRLPVCLKWSCLPAGRRGGGSPAAPSPVWTSSPTLWPTRGLPGLLVSGSSQRGQRAGASWERGRGRERCRGRWREAGRIFY